MDITELRRKIDELDRRLVELLNERARAAQEIGRLKRNTQMPIYEPEREQTIFANAQQANRGPLPEAELRHIYERIVDIMRKLQQEEIAPKAEGAASQTEFDTDVND